MYINNMLKNVNHLFVGLYQYILKQKQEKEKDDKVDFTHLNEESTQAVAQPSDESQSSNDTTS